MKKVTYSKEAVRALRGMPANSSKTIIAKIEQYAADPPSLANNIKALKGERHLLRLRVGDWRVIFSENWEVIAIIKIATRGDVLLMRRVS